jgi:hypothetical protein
MSAMIYKEKAANKETFDPKHKATRAHHRDLHHPHNRQHHFRHQGLPARLCQGLCLRGPSCIVLGRPEYNENPAVMCACKVHFKSA